MHGRGSERRSCPKLPVDYGNDFKLSLASCFLPVVLLLKAPEWSSVMIWRNLSDHIVKTKGALQMQGMFSNIVFHFYQALVVQASNNGHAIDLSGRCLNQVGPLEMRSLPSSANGVVVFAYPFFYTIFKLSFLHVSNKDDQGHFSMQLSMSKSVFFLLF